MKQGDIIAHDHLVEYIDNDYRGDGPVLLFLHDIGNSKELWTDIINQMEGYRGVAIDIRYSIDKKILSPEELLGLANDVHVSAQALGIKNVTIIGHGMGAVVGMALAEQGVQWLENIVLVAPRFIITKYPMFKMFFDHCKKFFKKKDVSTHMMWCSYCTINDFKKLDCIPTLIMVGEDGVSHATKNAIRHVGNNTEKTDVCIIPNCRHFPFFEQPDISYPSLVHWIQNIVSH